MLTKKDVFFKILFMAYHALKNISKQFRRFMKCIIKDEK